MFCTGEIFYRKFQLDTTSWIGEEALGFLHHSPRSLRCSKPVNTTPIILCERRSMPDPSSSGNLIHRAFWPFCKCAPNHASSKVVPVERQAAPPGDVISRVCADEQTGCVLPAFPQVSADLGVDDRSIPNESRFRCQLFCCPRRKFGIPLGNASMCLLWIRQSGLFVIAEVLRST